MEKIINTALQYISVFFNTDAVLFHKDSYDFKLPNPYSSEKENQIVCQLFDSTQDSVFYLNDRLSVSYCLAFLQQNAILVGPYRTGSLHRSDFPLPLFSSEQERQIFFQYYTALPEISLEAVKRAVRLIFFCVYGYENQLHEEEINIREYLRGEIPLISSDPNLYHSNEPNYTEENLYYITQIRSGNYTAALASYMQIMRGKGSPFDRLRATEGLSVMRTLTRIALSLAEVPDSSSDKLLTSFKNQCRNVSNVNQAVHLCQWLIEKSCDLVKQRHTKQYSSCIQEAIGYIHENLTQAITAADLADAAKLSVNRFSTRFHDEVGMTPSAYIRYQRMQMAARMLVYTNLDIQHICTNVGILDSNYFTKCFKKEYGMSPSDYRKRGIIDDPIT